MKKILVVEDNLMMRKMIINLFKNEKVEVFEASNGIEGLELINNHHFDLVITDIIMPKMEGIEFISRLKKEHPTVKVFAISGSKPYYLYLAKMMGTDGIFTKPLNKTRFLNHVNKFL